jgi:membrane protease YdiL (CAAX protease family)
VAGLGLPVAIALIEGLQYRGYVLTALAERWPFRSAAVVSSILFAPMHLLVNPPELVGTAVIMGLLFAVLRWATGTLWLPVGFHVAYNWSHWQLFPDGPLPSWLTIVDGPRPLEQWPSPVIEYGFTLAVLVLVGTIARWWPRRAAAVPGSGGDRRP